MKKSRAVASFCACVLSMAVFSMGMIASAAAETVEVRIPVTCTGTDCTAVLYNREGKEINRLELEKDNEGFLETLCEGPGDEQYLVKLDDVDSESRTFDRTVYHVMVTTFRRDDGRLIPVITLRKVEAEDKEENGKQESLRFANTSDSTDASVQTEKKKPIDLKLPQTGSLFLWLAPWLALVGTGMTAAGIRKRMKSREKKE